MSANAAVTEDAFLDGRLRLKQPAEGYRAGLDAVLLASAVRLEKGDALELGCGAGAALLSAALANPAARFAGVERDPQAAALARANIAANALDDRARVIEGDALSSMTGEAFDLVFTNPPFYEDAAALRAPPEAKRAAFMAQSPLADWIGAGLKALRPRGRFLLIHRTERLGDVLAALARKAGDIRVKPVAPRPGLPAARILVSARKGAKAPMQLLAPLVLHPEGACSSYSSAAEAILRGAARLEV